MTEQDIKAVDVTRDVEQLAMFMNARDNAESGTVLWDQLDHAGREEYTKEAMSFVSAMVRLGWRKQ